MSKRKKGSIVIIVIVVALIIFRIFLPSIITSQVNKRLADLDGYQGSISDVNLHLYRGAAKIYDFQIDKYEDKQKDPFIEIPESEFSLEWKSLFKGSIVGQMTLFRPSLNIDIKENGEAEQTGEEIDWVSLIKDLTPIKINTFEIKDAQLDVDFEKSDEPQFDFDMKQIDVLITNITNVEDKSNALPSDIVISSNLTNYFGALNINAKANMLKEIPDMDMNVKLEGLKLESLNPFLLHYAKMDFNGGTLNLYSEMALKDSKFDGYLKPSLQDPVLFKAKEEGRGLVQAAKEFVVEGVQELFENQKEEQTAAKIPISGSLDNVKINYWQSFITSVRNAYIQALKNNLDDTVAFANLSSD